MRTVRVSGTGREHPAEGRIGNDVVLVFEELRIEAGLPDHLAGIRPELAQKGAHLLGDSDADHTLRHLLGGPRHSRIHGKAAQAYLIRLPYQRKFGRPSHGSLPPTRVLCALPIS